MPGYVIHLAIGKEYLKNDSAIKNENAFFEGVMAPDLNKKINSHYGETSDRPNLNAFLDTNEMTDYNRGYFIHLITDYYFYSRYLKNFCWSSDLYEDYDKTNDFLITKYNLTIPSAIENVVKYKRGELKFLQIASLCEFIEKVAKINLRELIKKRNFDEMYDYL